MRLKLPVDLEAFVVQVEQHGAIDVVVLDGLNQLVSHFRLSGDHFILGCP